jgi:phospholipid/cholesterol/gamma-HCH transport system ATP-binding protein
MADDPPAVELRHVTKSFDGRSVLDDVCLTVVTGRSVCILGRSGTGKSVTLKHIVGLVRPDSGSVLVEGEDVTQMSSRDLSRVRKRIGFLFQNAALFDSIGVGANVEFPMRRHTRLSSGEIRERARRLLAQVGLEREYDKMPADLSGGMQKRAGLARALALDPPILLADEPGAGLDPVVCENCADAALPKSGVFAAAHRPRDPRRITWGIQGARTIGPHWAAATTARPEGCRNSDLGRFA